MKTIPHVRELAQAIRTLELKGKYVEAFECATAVWKDIESRPVTKGLSKRDAGDLLLRCGKLAGLLGRMQNAPEAQENAKNLLSNAREIFIELEDVEGIVESENGLALAYLRNGERREAETWIDSSLSRDLAASSFARMESFVCKSMLFLNLRRYKDVVEFLRNVETFFQKFDDDYLNGCFSANLGIAYRNLDKFPEAMQMYSLARHYHKKSGHLVYLAAVENNLAYLHKEEGRFDLAHKCVSRARELHKKIGDVSRLGFSYDSEADMFFAESKFEKALEAIEKALDILRGTRFADFLIESLLTKMKILAATGQIAEAALSFNEAAVYASQVQGEDRVMELADEFEKTLKKRGFSGLGRIYTQRIIAGEDLELVLPQTLAMYSDFEAVWIKNSDLEDAGLYKGSLALLVGGEPDRGEIVALVEEGCDEVVCGYFDQEFGVIAISNDRSSEPQVFNEDSVEILGKIVGYADPEDRREGKLRVKLLRVG